MRSEFFDELENTILSILSEAHTIRPGKIISYDNITGFSVVQPLGKFQTPDGQYIDYPLIHQVPVWLFEDPDSNIAVSRPIRAGQGCIILFSETAIDDWYYNIRTAGQLRFDLTNAICIPGLFARPSANVKEANDKNAVIVRNGGNSIIVKTNDISMTSTGTINVTAAGTITFDAPKYDFK